jgi:hypothetical protein
MFIHPTVFEISRKFIHLPAAVAAPPSVRT